MKIPNHIGIIVDGNGRWAQARGLKRSEGHLAGSKRLNSICEYILSKGVNVISLYVFSTENFKRSEEEVNYLMELFVKKFEKEFEQFHKKGIKVLFSGRRKPLKKEVLEVMDKITVKTKDNTNGTINFCLNYGSHSEIVDACKKIKLDCDNGKLDINDLNEDIFNHYLYQDLPNLDLIIRTGGEIRLSNFMMWQASYSEFYFTDTFFPDFDEKEFDKALENYQNRDRRFGGINYEKKSN